MSIDVHIWTLEEGLKLHQAYKRRWEKENYRFLRLKAIAKLGGVCVWCGARASKTKLELHHVRYAEGSIKDGHARDRALEALKHPSRFKLLCRKCHMAFEPEKYPRPRFAGRAFQRDNELNELWNRLAGATYSNEVYGLKKAISRRKQELIEGHNPETVREKELRNKEEAEKPKIYVGEKLRIKVVKG